MKTFFYWSFRVDLGFDTISNRHVILHPCFAKRLPINYVAFKYCVSPDCVTRSLPKLMVYEML